MPKDLAPLTALHVYVALRLADPRSDLLLREAGVLRAAVALARARRGFHIDTAVLLPAAVMMICRLDAGDGDLAMVRRLIRSAFARQTGHAPDIWARGDDERVITDLAELALYRHLCATAPIRAGLVRRPRDWPHSSVARRADASRDGPPALPRAVVEARGPTHL